MINISEMEFSKIKANIIEYYKQQVEFQDYNFEASGLNILIDTLAYMVHYLGFYLNASATEVFLDSALIRKNVISIAKSLNYFPRSVSGAESIIDIKLRTELIPEDDSIIISLPKYTSFASGGYNFYLMNDYALNNANGYSFENLKLRQGIINEQEEVSNGQTNQSYVIRNKNVDTQTIKIFVDDELWSLQNNITQIDGDSKIYSLEMTEEDKVKIIFGDNILGYAPLINKNIKIIYAETVGKEGNNLILFTLNQIVKDNLNNIYDNSKFEITTKEQSLGGSDEESISSIKLNAPRQYASQDRLVQKSDYISYINKHQYVQEANVWGGEEEPSPVYGKVIIAVKPVGAKNLTSNQKQEIDEYIGTRNVLTVHRSFKDLIYINIDVAGTIFYKQQYESSVNITQNIVNDTINNFFTDLKVFDSIFKYAGLVTLLFNLERVNNINILISPYITFKKNITNTYLFDLGNRILSGSVNCTILHNSIDEGFFDEDGDIISKKTNLQIGTVDYEAGTIEILPGYQILSTEPQDGFKIYFKTYDGDINYRKNYSILPGQFSLNFIRS